MSFKFEDEYNVYEFFLDSAKAKHYSDRYYIQMIHLQITSIVRKEVYDYVFALDKKSIKGAEIFISRESIPEEVVSLFKRILNLTAFH